MNKHTAADALTKGFVAQWIAALLVVLSCGGPSALGPDARTRQPPAQSPWGAEDQRGAANWITPAKVLEAARLIEEGKVYQLGRLYEEGMPVYENRSFKLRTQAAGPFGNNRLTAHQEFVESEIGQVGTQFDGLGHIGVGDLFYNGFDRRNFASETGLTKLGVENAGAFFTRGLLLDVAAFKGVDRLSKGYEITVYDLQGALQREGLKIRTGDVVILHTGWGSLWNIDNKLFASGKPGLGKAAARHLASRQISMVGTDAWGPEAIPEPEPEEVHPVHQILISLNGIYVMENLDTSELVRDGIHEFAFIFAPLRLKGASGSPGNPIAVK
jgi:kynurenine formamidase